MNDEEKKLLLDTFNRKTSKSRDNYEINFFHKVSYRDSERYKFEAESKMDTLLK